MPLKTVIQTKEFKFMTVSIVGEFKNGLAALARV
jgi:hypothetical protein